MLEGFWIEDKEGNKYLVREPVPEDVEGLLNLINTLVEERAYVTTNSRVSLEEEKRWLQGVLKSVSSGNLIFWVVEKDGRIVGGVEARRNPTSERKQEHLVELAIALLPEARDKGLGSKLLIAMIDHVMSCWQDVLIFLRAFAENERAVHVYKKIGFIEVARLPAWHNHFGRYIDDVVLVWPESPVLVASGWKPKNE